MEALRKTLELIFLRENPDKVLIEGVLPAKYCRDERVISAREVFPSLTLDQIETICHQLDDVWMQERATSQLCFVRGQSSIFNTLLYFSGDLLSTPSDLPVVKFDHLLRWNNTTTLLTEDLFTTSFLASRDIAFQRSRSRFDWGPCIEHDNVTLNNVLRKPMAELHSHLKGASLNFELNWLCLMNRPWNRDAEFAMFSSSQNPSYVTDLSGYNKPSMYYLVIKAAAIRMLLFLDQLDVTSTNIDEIFALVNAMSLSEQKIYIEALKREIGVAKYLYTKRFGSCVPDYSITNTCCPDSSLRAFTVLTGERALMYNAFKSIYRRSKETKLDSLFYAYILIKNQFRQELMQTNLYKGFANFGIYERRKEGFIPDESPYSKLVQAEAVASFFAGKSPDSYLEVRVTPKPYVFELDKSIKGLVSTIGNEINFGDAEKEKYRFILHFIKVRDRYVSGPRHARLRDSVRQSSVSLIRWRNLEFNLNAERIVGIDAANSELFCRPEVFSQAYRFCRQYSWNHHNQHPNELHFTYHVGEDFYDIIDGLRAVWESVHFLGLKRGDRIGHGLVLGTDVKSYYETRHGLVYLPKQVLLDNIAWLLHEATFPGPSDKQYRELSDLYQSLVAEIYEQNPELLDYFQAICLRGDNPRAYTNPSTVSRWHQLDLNDSDLATAARNNPKARELYIQYHFNADAVHRGNEVREFKIDESLIDVIDRVRKSLLHSIEEAGIAIETNPTSNLRIGHASTYRTLPLLEFNNVGLTMTGQYRGISVSINTDDRGVFGTSLEREFSLVAAALEKQYKKGESDVPPRVIYDWLDKIRQMAFEQVFTS